MRKLIEYQTIATDGITQLDKYVNKALAKGWEILNPLIIGDKETQYSYIVVMGRYEKCKEESQKLK